MTKAQKSRVLYVGLGILNLMIGTFIYQVGRGEVPFPDNLVWTIPILLTGLNALAMYLPRLGSEPIAEQVDRLKKRGVPRSEMQVVPRPVVFDGEDRIVGRRP